MGSDHGSLELLSEWAQFSAWDASQPVTPMPCDHDTLTSLTTFATRVVESKTGFAGYGFDGWIREMVPPDVPAFSCDTTIEPVTRRYITRFADSLREPYFNGHKVTGLLGVFGGMLGADIRVYSGIAPSHEYAWYILGVAGALGCCYEAYPYYAMQEAVPLVRYTLSTGFLSYRERLVHLAQLKPIRKTALFHARRVAYVDYYDTLMRGLLLAALRGQQRTSREGWPTPRIKQPVGIGR